MRRSEIDGRAAATQLTIDLRSEADPQ